MTVPVCRYNGRDFSAEDLALIHELLALTPPLSRYALSIEFCRRVDWRKPDGGLKQMSARLAFLSMHRDGVITLPPPRRKQYRPKPIVPGPETDPPARVPASLEEARPLQITPVFGSTPAGALWNAFIDRYHYLGYRPLSGSQMRYTVSDRHGCPLALLGFEAAAWKTAPRDAFIGWSAAQRQRQLHLVVNNARFLILPWAHLPNLASHLLGRLHKQLPDDWQNRYTFRPVLLETFCEIPRFPGTVYRAANWTRVGQTQGRGRNDQHKQFALPPKHIFLQPLDKNWKSILNS